MKNIIQYITCISLALILFSSCEDNTLENFGTTTTVVQSYLYAENPVDSFYISESINYFDTSDVVATFDNLLVNISDGTDSYILQPIGNGYYQNLDLIIQSGTTYSMEFENEGTVISAETYVPEKKEISISLEQISIERVTAGGGMMPPTQTDPITVSWENNDNEYYYVIVQNIEANPEYINENFGNFGGGQRPQIITEPQIVSNYNVDTRQDIQFFGTYQIVVYRVNPEYAALYSTSEATSSSIVEPATNIENGLGIMTGISTDTILFEVNEL